MFVNDLSNALGPFSHTRTSGLYPGLVPEFHPEERPSQHHIYERHEWNPTSPDLLSLTLAVAEVDAAPALLVGTNPLSHLKVPLVFVHSHPG